MNKNIKLAAVIMGLGVVLFSYQNCSQIKPGLIVTDNKVSGLDADGGTQAIILDQEDNIVEVVPNAEQPIVQEEIPDQDPQPEIRPDIVKDDHDDKEHNDKEHEDKEDIVKDEVEHEDSPEEIQASSCIELAKKYKNSIDVSQLPAGAKINLLKGKTFIYSSSGVTAISSLSIGKVCGRTILCNVKVGKIGVVNGRLDLYKNSTVGEYGSQPKNIKSHQ